jgi:hypothetical protein
MPKQFQDARILPLQDKLLPFQQILPSSRKPPRRIFKISKKFRSSASKISCHLLQEIHLFIASSFNNVRREDVLEDGHPGVVHEMIHDLDVLWARPAMFLLDGQRNHARDAGLRREFRVRD